MSGKKEWVVTPSLAIILLIILSGCEGKTLTLNNNTDNTKSTQEPSGESESMKVLGLDIELLGQASVRIKDKKVIYIDPFQLIDDSSLIKADLILITHPHYDHCSIKDVAKIVQPSTIIVTVADCQSKLSNLTIKEMKLMIPGKTIQIDNEKITAMPAYNINKQFHPRINEWVGFIIEMDGLRIYHAGDTDAIPEMKTLDVDIAFLPVGGTYTMNGKEAAQATKLFKRCKIAIPMHYGSIVGSASEAEDLKEKAVCEVIKLM